MNFYEIIQNFHDTLHDKKHDAILILSMVKDTTFAHVNTSLVLNIFESYIYIDRRDHRSSLNAKQNNEWWKMK